MYLSRIPKFKRRRAVPDTLENETIIGKTQALALTSIALEATGKETSKKRGMEEVRVYSKNTPYSNVSKLLQ